MSLAIQDYLRAGNTAESLTASLGIRVYRHPTLPLVGFKYSQLESPKTHPVVRDARGIVLEDGTWNVVAKPFRRFFNAGEDQENFAKFNWSNFTATSKEDGSLILVYFYAGEWHVNTSGSFGLDQCYFSGRTWRELFWEVSGIDRGRRDYGRLDPDFTYIFEMWTPFNKVIRVYPEPSVFLLSAFDNRDCHEVHVSTADYVASHLRVRRPQHYHFTSMDDIAAFLLDREATDKTFEGIVIRDDANERYKVKSKTYLALHHLFDNGNVFNPKRLVPLALAGEIDEVLAYLPEIKPQLTSVQAKLDSEFAELQSLWHETKAIDSQKEFAQAIVPRTPFSSLLFKLRKQYGEQPPVGALDAAWRSSAELIVKTLEW